MSKDEMSNEKNKDEITKCRTKGINLTMLTAEALAIPSKIERVEKCADVLDQIDAFEDEYETQTRISVMVGVYIKNLRSMIEEDMENKDEILSANEGGVSDEVRKCIEDGHNVTVLAVEALIEFEKLGEREQFAAVLDEITTYEKKYKQYEDAGIPMVVDVYTRRLRSMISKVQEQS